VGTVAAGEMVYAIACEAATGATAATKLKVYFKGDDGGFGVNHA